MKNKNRPTGLHSGSKRGFNQTLSSITLIGADGQVPPPRTFSPVPADFSCSRHGSLTMLRRRLPSLGPGRFKYIAVIVVLALFLLAQGLPSLKSSFDAHVGDLGAGDDRPRYLYHSTFRDDPDLEYEHHVSRAMREIEEAQLALDGEDTTNTLWQILLDPAERRGDDSLQFEEKNSEWKYFVRISLPVHALLGAPTYILASLARQQRMGRTVRHYNPRIRTRSGDSIP